MSKTFGTSSKREEDLANSPCATPEMIRKRLRTILTPEQRRAYEQYVRDHDGILKGWMEAAK